jgi:hypothetical protein
MAGEALGEGVSSTCNSMLSLTWVRAEDILNDLKIFTIFAS